MNARSLIAAAGFAAIAALPGMAAAQSVAYAINDGYTNLREGPGPEYRARALIYPGTRLDVMGCLATNDWCDVIAQDIRGWVATSRMVFDYARPEVVVPDYEPSYDEPFFQFRFGGRHRDHDRDHRHRRHDDNGRRHHDRDDHRGGHRRDNEVIIPQEPDIGQQVAPPSPGDFDTRPPRERGHRQKKGRCTADLACPN